MAGKFNSLKFCRRRIKTRGEGRLREKSNREREREGERERGICSKE